MTSEKDRDLTSDELFERRVWQLRRKHGAELWRILARLVEREIWTMPADLARAYQADPARAEADLLPKYRTVYLARHAVAALPGAVSNRRRLAKAGAATGKKVSADRAPLIEEVRKWEERLRARGWKEREIAAEIALRTNELPDRVRRIRLRLRRAIKASTS